MAFPLDPPDRARKPPVYGLGADTIVVRGPVDMSVIEQLPDRHFGQQYDDMTGELTDVLRSGSTAVTVGETKVRVYADLRAGVPEVRLEFSAPSLLYGHNRDPTDLNLLSDVVEVALQIVSEEICGMPSFEQLRPIRLDIPRNFPDVESPSKTLEAISRLPVTRGQPDRIVRGSAGGVQTLMRGNTNRWLIRGYDKYEQMLDVAQREPWRRDLLMSAAEGNRGLLRVEVQLKSHFLRERGINRVDDIDTEDMHNVADAFFQRARFGEVIGGSTRLRDLMTSLSDRDARGVSAVLLAELAGYDPPLSRNPLSTYRALARRLGLTTADLLGGDTEPRRLDFRSGRELLGMDATKVDLVS